jgi:hypothetical protein
VYSARATIPSERKGIVVNIGTEMKAIHVVAIGGPAQPKPAVAPKPKREVAPVAVETTQDDRVLTTA